MAGERERDGPERCRQRADRLERRSERLAISRDEGVEAAQRRVEALDRHRRDGAEVEDRDAAVAEHEYVIGIDGGVGHTERPLRAE